jgi:hypothetical protein
VSALQKNTTAGNNTASGYRALQNNTIGSSDTASGAYALLNNTNGSNNCASGFAALNHNTTGLNNTADGANALLNNTTGKSNIAVGSSAGANLTTGSNNIDIGAPGAAAEANAIHIGGTQTNTYVAGIYNATVTAGSLVYIDSNGKLATNNNPGATSQSLRNPKRQLASDSKLLDEFHREHRQLLEQQRKIEEQDQTIAALTDHQRAMERTTAQQASQIKALVTGLEQVNTKIEMRSTPTQVATNNP